MSLMFGLVVLVGGQAGANQDYERKLLAYEALIARTRSSSVTQGGLEDNDRFLGYFSGQVQVTIIGRLASGDSALMTSDHRMKAKRDKLWVLRKPGSSVLPEKASMPGDALFYKTGETAKIRNIDCEVVELVIGADWDNIRITASKNVPNPRNSLGDTSGLTNQGAVDLMIANSANEIHQRKHDNMLKFERARLESIQRNNAELAAAKADADKKKKAEAEVANRIPNENAALDKLVSDVAKSVANFKRINSSADADWYTQIEFSKRAITRHIEKLEQAKAGWAKLKMDPQMLADMTKKADAAIALGKATLGKGGAR